MTDKSVLSSSNSSSGVET